VPYLWYEPNPPEPIAGRPGLLIMAHGGPTAYATYEFSWVIELACRSGLAVASVDYRGSTSYGRSHRVALNGHWGQFDVEDVEAVLNDIVASGAVDTSRVFVRGNSAGAVSALLVASRAPVSGVVVVSPVTDPQSLLASTDDFDCGYAEQLTGGADLAAQRSPVHHLDTMPSRALIIHGSADPIVPVTQTRAFVADLRAHGRDVTYVEMEGEGHSFRSTESNRRAFLAEVTFYTGPKEGP
jgi:dipeptidyl aminopeptidase/acylaminoacyl peptidase